MREAIAQYLEREEKRDAFRQATLDAWDEYQTTGQYATEQQVEAWLSSWGTDTETKPPSWQS
jgi:predicted transcriptional regulator